MNGIRPTVGIEFDDEYINAKNKLIEFVKAWSELNPLQREQLTLEVIASCEVATSFEQVVGYMNSRR